MNGPAPQHQKNNMTQGFDNNVKAIISAFFGALSLLSLLVIVFIGMLFGLISIVLGIIGLREMRNSGQYGKGMAITGIICGSVSVGLPLFVSVAFMVAG
ncbi:DUF4190 domain-containing protein [Salipaludibacillus aurantiacus]|uniref:DUF4190 domain-containing protein n=1 Tax=Salipaludibacillus aurantiacus TaxID=1601833 RepID=A0A1H9X9X5_9BACI|nr:DUF4190 domain-containing protein [Salipaludibacillus aurantiacus]SES43008.1 protein of unknown function [Salipaludibacillus aurantiacus]